MTRVFSYTLLVCLLLLGCGPLFSEVKTYGYYENRLFLLDKKEEAFKNFHNKFFLGDYNRLRLQFQSSQPNKYSLNLAIDFFTFHGIINNPVGVYSETGDAQRTATYLDRAYLELYFPGFDISIGKQRVAFGVSHLWAPLDLFNRVNIFEPKEEKPGVNAFKIYVPLGTSSAVTGVFSPEKDFRSSKSGLRIKTLLGGVDAAVNIIRQGERDQTIYGIDLRGEAFLGWWVEGGYFTSSAGNHLKVVLGFDYTFSIKRGLFWMTEFFYDESGEKDSAAYDFEKLLAQDRFTLGKKYLLSTLSFPVNNFLSLSAAYIGNWTDGSAILSPSLMYEIAQNLSLNVGYFFLLGKKGGEFNRKEGYNIFYIWIKANF